MERRGEINSHFEIQNTVAMKIFVYQDLVFLLENLRSDFFFEHVLG